MSDPRTRTRRATVNIILLSAMVMLACWLFEPSVSPPTGSPLFALATLTGFFFAFFMLIVASIQLVALFDPFPVVTARDLRRLWINAGLKLLVATIPLLATLPFSSAGLSETAQLHLIGLQTIAKLGFAIGVVYVALCVFVILRWMVFFRRELKPGGHPDPTTQKTQVFTPRAAVDEESESTPHPDTDGK